MTEVNLALWSSVEKTDPSQTKAITGKPYNGTSPKPYYLVRKATEIFGPCGIGWGFIVVSERVEDGAEGDKVHIAHVRVWYIWNGMRGEVEHVGQTMFSGRRRDGKTYTDEDAPKKSVTDALVKALSMIGFAGDIFMGRYDDSKYVNELRQEERQRSEPHGPAVSSSDPTPLPTALGRDLLLSTMKMAKNEDELQEWSVKNAEVINDLGEPQKDEIRKAYRKKLGTFQDKAA